MRSPRPLVVVLSIVVAAVLTGCMPSTAPASSSGDPVGTWGSVGDRTPYLTLEADGVLSGKDGCNGLGGTWSQEDASAPVEFHDVFMTLMYCDGVDQWLNAGRSAIVDGDTIFVLDEGGKTVGSLDRQ